MYIERTLESTIEYYLKSFKCVVLVGPKFCGKTTLADKLSKSNIYLNTINKETYKTMLQMNSNVFFEGPYPKLIDEWQIIPEVWDSVRHTVDRIDGRGLFILTGSSAANFNSTEHSGAGRFVRVSLRPMSLFEVGVSNGLISLESLFDDSKFNSCKSELTINEYALWIIKGGWPESINDNERISITRMNSYLEAICKEDVNKVTGKKYNENRIRKIIESLARNTASEATNKKIMDDLSSVDSSTSENTLADYLDILQKLYLIEDLHSWNPNLRSRTRIKASPARLFVDPSIGASALNLTTSKLLRDFNTFGLFFESLVIRDLRIYTESIQGKVYRYKDKNGLEIDAIIQLNDGRWGAIQVKMGNHLFDDAAKKLVTFANSVDEEKMGSYSFLAIISATDLAYQREDGVYVIPLGCLKQ